MTHAEIRIDGMSCKHCIMAVREELLKLKGLVLHEIHVGGASVDYDETLVSRGQITDAVREAGYDVAAFEQGR